MKRPVDSDEDLATTHEAGLDKAGFDKTRLDKAGLPPKAKVRRCTHLWKVAAQLKSENQGTLKEFVEKNR